MTDELDSCATPRKKNLLTRVRKTVEDCFQKAEKHFEIKIPRAKISFDLTGTSAGTSCYAKKLLRFNRKLLIENEDEFLTATCQHEISHHICRHLHGYGVKSHGNEWKKIMVEVFRVPPKRTHHMDTTNVRRKVKEYTYTCDCPGKEFHFGKIKHDKIKRGNVCQCPKCFSVLTFQCKGSPIKPKGLTETEL